MIIIQDTREQIPLDFSFFINTTVAVRKVDIGDYSLEGYEDKVFLERKRSTGELSLNFGQDSKRFYKELEKTKDIKFKYIICEFTINDVLSFPENSGIPQKFRKNLMFNGKALYKIIKQIESQYGIRFIFCEDSSQAAEEVVKILKKVKEHYSVGF